MDISSTRCASAAYFYDGIVWLYSPARQHKFELDPATKPYIVMNCLSPANSAYISYCTHLSFAFVIANTRQRDWILLSPMPPLSLKNLPQTICLPVRALELVSAPRRWFFLSPYWRFISGRGCKGEQSQKSKQQLETQHCQKGECSGRCRHFTVEWLKEGKMISLSYRMRS